MWTTKRKLKCQVEELENKVTELDTQLKETVDAYEEYISHRADLFQLAIDQLTSYQTQFPFNLGDIVYDIQLRNNKGRFTKRNPSKEYSVINEVIVDKKNYFNLVERYNTNDVFRNREEAQSYVESICVD